MIVFNPDVSFYYKRGLFIIAGTIDERTFEPTSEIDDRRTVLEPAACRGGGLRGGGQTRGSTLEGPLLSAGLQLLGFPETVGRGQHIAGERDRQVAGPPDHGHC